MIIQTSNDNLLRSLTDEQLEELYIKTIKVGLDQGGQTPNKNLEHLLNYNGPLLLDGSISDNPNESTTTW